MNLSLINIKLKIYKKKLKIFKDNQKKQEKMLMMKKGLKMVLGYNQKKEMKILNS